MALPLTNNTETERWYSECSKVQKALEKQFPDFEPEHETWHFFNDADIRTRDIGYKDYQHRLMSDYVKRLRATT